MLELFRSHDQPAVVFTDRGPDDADFIIAAYPTGRDGFDDYVHQNREHAEIDARWRPAIDESAGSRSDRNTLATRIFHICAIGTRSQMLEFQEAAHRQIAGRIQTFVQRIPRYRGTMCEILRHDAGKWAAILHLARLWRIDPSAICAVGDDVNDIPMIRERRPGCGHGPRPPEVLAAADLITG